MFDAVDVLLTERKEEVVDRRPRGPDRSAVRIERTFAAPVREVFEACTSRALLRRWYPPGADWAHAGRRGWIYLRWRPVCEW
jgi:hypothetical protein